MRLSLLMPCLLLGLAVGAGAQHPFTITFTDPDTVGESHAPGTDGILVFESQNFREAGFQVEAFWVKNDESALSAGHFHHLENLYERTHGFETEPGFGPDRLGVYLEREDGGEFSLLSLDYELTSLPLGTDIGVTTDFDPSLPHLAQFTLFPLTSQAGFTTLPIVGFENVTRLFVMAVLGIDQQDRVAMDDFQIEIPEGSCNDVARGVIAAHDGATDPLTEGWVREGLAVGVSEGPGVDAWEIDDASGAPDSVLRYAFQPDPDQMCWARTSGWTLTTRVSVVDAPDAADASVFAHVFDGLTAHELRIGSDAEGRPVVDLSGTVLTLTDLSSGEHVYQLVYDPATETTSLLVDDVATLAGVPGEVRTVSAARVAWGSDGESATGHGAFGAVSFGLPHRCEDGVDNDGDGLVDTGQDPGCAGWFSPTESPACQDGIDNDGDLRFDFDGGASANGGTPLGDPDPQCTSAPKQTESPPRRCGLGFELALLAPLLLRLRRRLAS